MRQGSEGGSLEPFFDESDSNVDSKRYQVEDKEFKNSIILERERKKKNIPFIFYVFIMSLLLLIGIGAYYAVEKINYERQFTSIDDGFPKPALSKIQYRRITFKNNLEVLLIKADENDTAGGAIVFDTGYLDDKYKEGYMSLFLNSLSMDSNKTEENISDYFGAFQYTTDEYYSNIRFQILNEGFFDYLKRFSQVLNFTYDNYDNLMIYRLKNLSNVAYLRDQGIRKREKHLLNYLVYGFKDENNHRDILRQGGNYVPSDQYSIILRGIKKIKDDIIQPSKMKIVLISHYKLSLMEAKFKRYFNYLINMKKDEQQDNKENKPLSYDEKKFEKKKIIFYQIDPLETNYFQINYFIDNPNDEKYSDLYLHSHYFQYIKYILSETKPGSLYYRLTNSKEYDIKSLTSNFEVVLKNKIKFTVNIELNSYSYPNLTDIIYTVYQHMDKINKFINEMQPNDSRYEELSKIFTQIFNFTEDSDDAINIAAKRGIDLYQKQENFDYFLKDNWLPPLNLDIIKKYFNQLKPENSVIIIGLNPEAQKQINCDENAKIYINFTNIFNSLNTTTFYRIKYKEEALDTSFIEYFEEDGREGDISFKKNEYVSNCDHLIIPDKEDINNSSLPVRVGDKESHMRVFYFKKDTSFRLPKVHIALTFYHPFLMPNSTQEEGENRKHCLFFEFMSYIAFCKREINITLADAIRAGNEIVVGFNKNFFYIDIFAYSDVVEKIVEEVKNIVLNPDYFDSDKADTQKYFTKNELYKQATLEDYLNIGKANIATKARFIFYSKLHNHFYNEYNFPQDFSESLYKKCLNNDTFLLDIPRINTFSIIVQVYGNYTLEKYQKIMDFFKEGEKEEERFNLVLKRASIQDNIDATNFVEWIKEVKNLKSRSFENVDIIRRDSYTFIRYLFWSEYNTEDFLKVFLLQSLFDAGSNSYEGVNLRCSYFKYNATYLQLTVVSRNATIENDKDLDSVIEYTVKKILEKKFDSYYPMIDGIGSRFYYLGKNLEHSLRIKRKNMFKVAVDYVNAMSFTPEDINEEDINSFISNIDLKDLINEFKKKLKTKPYLDFLPNK